MLNKVIKASVVMSAIFIVALTSQAQATVINNGSFETGDFTGWVTQDLTASAYPLSVASVGVSAGFFAGTPTDGTFSAISGFEGDGIFGPNPIRIAQDITVVNGLAKISFDYRAAWEVYGQLDRLFNVNIEVAGGGANLATFNILTAAAGTINYDTGILLGSVDLSAFVGQTVHLAFDLIVPEAYSGPASFMLDNIRSSASDVPVPASNVPEPTPLALLGLGLFGMGIVRKRRG